MSLTTHADYLGAAELEPGFQRFVDDVSPRTADGVQPVFWAEFFLVLKILWEIYQLLKARGWFQKWLTKVRIKKALAGRSLHEISGKSLYEKVVALEVIRDRYVRA